jgi:hypothetical protein
MNRFEKAAAEVVRPFKTHKTTWHLPSRSRDSVLSLDEAKSIADAMSAVARHNALDNTQVHLNGAIFKGLQDRLVNNERNSSITRFLGGLSDPFSNMPDKTSAGASDSFLPLHDAVFLPSGNPGVLAHELGHAVDMNEFPNTPFRRFTSGVYTRFAPTLWQEHAAWRKGKKRLIEGAPKVKMDPDLFTRTIEDAARTKPMGLGSYWGGGLGALAGTGLGIAGTMATGKGQLLPIGITLGGTLGALTGLSIGKMLGNRASLGSEEAKKKYLDLYVNAYAKEHGISPEEAASVIDTFRKANKPKLKAVQQGTNAMKGNIQKAAEFGAMMGKMAAYRGVSSVPIGAGPQQLVSALNMFNQAKTLVDPSDSLERQGLSREHFDEMIHELAAREGDKYNFSELKKNPKANATALGVLGALGGGLAGKLTGQNLGTSLGLAAAGGLAGAGGGYLGADSHNKKLMATAKVLKDYGLLKPDQLRSALPLLAS